MNGIFWRKKISNSIKSGYSGSASAFSTHSRRDILSDDDYPRTPRAPSVCAIRSTQSDTTSTSGASRKDISLWNIIQAQQQQLNRIQDQIDRLIVAVGGLPPKRAHEPLAISSAPASLAITSGKEHESRDLFRGSEAEDDDSDCYMSEEVAKLVRKYSTKLRE